MTFHKHDFTDEQLDDMLVFARKLAAGLFGDKKRKFNDEPYVNHCYRTATLVMKYKESNSLKILMIAAILHDLIEDTCYTEELMIQDFGKLIASLVMELTTPEHITKKTKCDYLCKKTVSMTSWGLVLKLCDRLENVTDLVFATKEFRKSYVRETKIIIGHLVTHRNLTLTQLSIVGDILKLINVAERIDIKK